jgi:hypothetical protein
MKTNKIAGDQAFDAMTIPMLEWNASCAKDSGTVVRKVFENQIDGKRGTSCLERVVKCRAPPRVILSQKRPSIHVKSCVKYLYTIMLCFIPRISAMLCYYQYKYIYKPLSFNLPSKSCWRMMNYWCRPVTFRLAWNCLNRKKRNERKNICCPFSFEFDERPWGLKWLYSLTRFGFLTDEPNGDATSGWTYSSHRSIRQGRRWRCQRRWSRANRAN